MANPFAWVEIPVDDMERARRFYEDVFETTLQRIPGTEFEMWMFDSDQETYGAGGALIKMPGYAAGKPGHRVFRLCGLCGPTRTRGRGRGHRPPAEDVARTVRLLGARRRRRRKHDRALLDDLTTRAMTVRFNSFSSCA